MKYLLKFLKYLAVFLAFIFILTLAGATILYANKNSLWVSIKEKLSVTLKSHVEIQSIGISFNSQFPNLSLSFEQLSIVDSITKSEVFHIDKFNAEIDFLSVLQFKPKIYGVIIEDANLDLVTDKNGDLNFSVLNIKDTSRVIASDKSKPISLHFEIPIQRIVLKNVAIRLLDTLNHKNIGIKAVNCEIEISQLNNETALSINGPVYFSGLGFNTKLGYFLKDKTVEAHILAKIPANEEKLYFLPSYVLIDEERYEVQGYFKPGIYPDIAIIIHTDNAVVTKVLPNLSENVSQKIAPYQVTNTVHAVITIAGPLIPNQDPSIDLRFWSKDNNFKFGNLPITVKGINFEGIVCNHVNPSLKRGDPNTSFEIKDVTGKIGFGDLAANIKIMDLINPTVDASANISLNLASLASSFHDFPLEHLEGKAKLDIAYNGKLPQGQELSLLPKWRYYGHIFLDNINFKGGGIKYEKISGKLDFQNDTLTFPKGFSFQIAGNKVLAKGYVYKPVQHFLIPDTLLRSHIKLQSPNFNINNLLVQSAPKVKTTKPRANSKQSITAVRKVLQNMQFKIDLDFQKAIFKKLEVQNLTGKLIRRGEHLELKDINFSLSGGKMEVNATADHLDTEKQTGSATIQIKNIDVKKLFYGMENFGQNAITSQNLEGKFNANLSFSSSFDEGFKLKPNTMKGKFDFSLRNGHLKNFEPLQKISKYLFTKRDFTDISFDELSQHATLRGKTLYISDMKIQSNVLTLFVNGSYHFDNIVDLKIRVPWFNLRSNGKYLSALEEDPEHAKAIHIRAFTKNGKVNFGLGK